MRRAAASSLDRGEGACLDEIEKGIGGQVRIGQAQEASIGIREHGGQLLETIGQIQVAVRGVGGPSTPAAETVVGVAHPGEREGVLFESRRVGPEQRSVL